MAIVPPSPHSQLWRWEIQKTLIALAGAGGSIFSDTPPPSPANGTLWFETDTGILWVWYDDGNSQQWVQVGGPYAQQTARPVNKFSNPCMQVSQENGTNLVTTSGAYPADQAMVQAVGIVIQARNDNQQASPDGNVNYISLNASTAKPTLAAGDYMQMVFPVEGLDIADLMWGQNGAIPAVLRFTAYAFNAGKYAFSIGNAAGDWTYVGSFDIAAYTPTTFVFAIPAPSSPYGSWTVANSLGLSFRVCTAAGSNFVGVAGWQNSNKLAPPGCYNGAAQSGQSVYVTDIGLYADPQATGRAPPFQRPLYEDALRKARRYWWCSNPEAPKGSAIGRLVGYTITTAALGYNTWRFTVPMRIAPAAANITLWANGTQNQLRNTSSGAFFAVAGVVTSYLNSEGGGLVATGATTASIWCDFDMIVNARMI